MIAQWIARAVMAGRDHLVLTKRELAKWRLQGCRVSNGGPHNQWTPYARHKLGTIQMEAEEVLMKLPVSEWHVGLYPGWDGLTGPCASFAANQAERVDAERWAVPLIPADTGHALNAWSFDLGLTPTEMTALRPMARGLVRHSLLTSYCTSYRQMRAQTVPWDSSRQQLALLGGYSLDDLKLAFKAAKALASMTPKAKRCPYTLAMLESVASTK